VRRGRLGEGLAFYRSDRSLETFPAGTPVEVVSRADVDAMGPLERAEALAMRRRSDAAERRAIMPGPPEHLAYVGGLLRRVPQAAVLWD
jgi:hypothetical protein